MATERSSSRTRATARTEIMGMLKEDHKRTKKAFRDFEKLDPHNDPEACRELVERVCGELEVHAALEEELFYPEVKQAIKDTDLVEEAEVEHMSAKSLIAQLRSMSPEDPKYAATFTVLGEYIKHHIKEEENEMFPQLDRARLDWDHMAEQMHERRDALMEQFLPQGSGGKIAGQQASSSSKH